MTLQSIFSAQTDRVSLTLNILTIRFFMIPRNSVILFQGDSITDAFRKPEEINEAYRMGNGYAFLIAARLLAERPGDHLRFENRGVSGNGLSQLAERWQRDCLDVQPDVLSILIGVNETISRFKRGPSLSEEDFEMRYCELLEQTRQVLPGIRLILCEPFLLNCGLVEDGWIEFMAARQQQVRDVARHFEAIFVPLQSVLDRALSEAPPEYWAYDGVHPTAAGHQLLAEAWLSAVANENLTVRNTMELNHESSA